MFYLDTSPKRQLGCYWNVEKWLVPIEHDLSYTCKICCFHRSNRSPACSTEMIERKEVRITNVKTRGSRSRRDEKQCSITEKRVQNTTRSGLFLAKFEVFGNAMKHCLSCLIYYIQYLITFDPRRADSRASMAHRCGMMIRILINLK